MKEDKDLRDLDFDDCVNEMGQTYVEFLLSELRRMAVFVNIRHSKEKELLSDIVQLMGKIKRMEDNGAIDPDPRGDNY